MVQHTSEYRNPRLRVAVIFSDLSGRVLLLEHVRANGSYWVLPGGGVDAGESLEAAAQRETREELSVRCRIGRLVAVGELITDTRHVVDFFVTGEIEDGDSTKVCDGEGIGRMKWADPDEIGKLEVLPSEIVPVLLDVKELGVSGPVVLGKYKVK